MSDTDPSTINFAQLIGPPALLPGEDAAQYEALRAEVRKCLEPKSVLDETNVSDVTDKIWEAQRYKRFEVRLIEGSRVECFGSSSDADFRSGSRPKHSRRAEYFGRDPDQSKLARELMSALQHHRRDDLRQGACDAMQGKSPISNAWSATAKPPATACCASTNDGKDGPTSWHESAVPTIMKRRPGKKSRPRNWPHPDHGDRETDCRQPRQCQAQHWPKNRGWTRKVQPQRVSARPVAGIAA